MSDLYYYANLLDSGYSDGNDAIHGDYVVIRYTDSVIGSEENEDPVIENPDWYSIAWVSLLQVLPDAKINEVIKTTGFAALADHVRFWIVTGEADELLSAYCFKNMRVNVNDKHDIIVHYIRE